VTAILADVLVGVGLLAALAVALEIGFRLGKRASEDADPRAAGQVGAVQGAVLGLLGLLLAFSFAAAGSRFLEKQDLIVTEANAIGTATLRADLLDQPHRSELRAALREYTEYRIQLSAQLRSGMPVGAHSEIERQHARIWNAAVEGVAARPAAILAVLDPMNELIDLHSTRLAAGRKHLPMVVLGLLIACSLLAIGVIGYGSGMGGRRRLPLTLSLTLLVGAALWITIDLDYPRGGLLQLSDAPLQALKFDATP
jgi:hypothetical protein